MIKLSDYGYRCIQIETKSSCNMNCSFCPYQIKVDKGSVLNDEIIYRLIDEISADDVHLKYITFSQFNEPLLDNRRLFDFIQYAKSKGHRVLLITNGLLLNKKRNIQNILDSSVDYIKISLQSLSEEKFSDIRGVDVDFMEYLSLLNNFLSQVNGTQSIVTIDLGCNFRGSSKFSEIINKLIGVSHGDPSISDNIHEVYSDIYGLISEWKKPEYMFNPELCSEDLRWNRNMDDAQGSIKVSDNILFKIKPFHDGMKLSKYYPSYHFSCNTDILSVLADGSVVPCCLDYNGELSMGNVNDNSIEEVLLKNRSFLSDLRNKNGEKKGVCCRCYGAPSKRGAVLKTVYNHFQ